MYCANPKLVAAFLMGVIFALGLGIGGMTQPTKIIGFLDVAGHWDPTLAFVMGGAVAVTFVSFPLILRRPHPVLEQRFFLPEKRRIDVRLLAGAALFGVGWGMSGYCPGPALVSLVTLERTILVFVTAMALGLYGARRLTERIPANVSETVSVSALVEPDGG